MVTTQNPIDCGGFMKPVSSFLLFVALLLIAAPAQAISFKKAINNVNPSAKYFFYLHGAIMEKQGRNATSPRHGPYLYDSIIEHFEDRGLTVIEEVRGEVKPHQYASKVAMQVRKLMAAGVPAENICVGGFSKGGFITLLVASSLNESGVAYVVMAGCGKGKYARPYEQFLKMKRGARLKGRVYSIYAGSDLDAQTCRKAFEQSSGDGFIYKENRVKSGKGHGLFYQPRPQWVDPVAIWAKGGR